jgi:hypothetical protein
VSTNTLVIASLSPGLSVQVMVVLMSKVSDSSFNCTVSDEMCQCVPRYILFKKRRGVMVLFQECDDYRLPFTSFDRFGRSRNTVLECAFHR